MSWQRRRSDRNVSKCRRGRALACPGCRTARRSRRATRAAGLKAPDCPGRWLQCTILCQRWWREAEDGEMGVMGEGGLESFRGVTEELQLRPCASNRDHSGRRHGTGTGWVGPRTSRGRGAGLVRAFRCALSPLTPNRQARWTKVSDEVPSGRVQLNASCLLVGAGRCRWKRREGDLLVPCKTTSVSSWMCRTSLRHHTSTDCLRVLRTPPTCTDMEEEPPCKGNRCPRSGLGRSAAGQGPARATARVQPLRDSTLS